MSLLFILPLISGIWSEDKKEWLNILRIKLPLLVLPLAFASPFIFSPKQWQALAFIFIALITAGTVWSMFHYVPDMAAVNEGYLRAKTMITPLEDDHVRFSWLISMAVLFTAWLWWQQKEQKNVSPLAYADNGMADPVFFISLRPGQVCYAFISFLSQQLYGQSLKKQNRYTVQVYSFW